MQCTEKDTHNAQHSLGLCITLDFYTAKRERTGGNLQRKRHSENVERVTKDGVKTGPEPLALLEVHSATRTCHVWTFFFLNELRLLADRRINLASTRVAGFAAHIVVGPCFTAPTNLQKFACHLIRIS